MPLSRAHRISALIAGASLLLTTPAAAASAIPSAGSISPWAALSAFGTQASGAALCASSVAAASAAQAAPARPGCVLPVVDAVPPPVVTGPPPVAALPPAVGGGLGISPLLLGLGLLTVIGLLALAHGDDDDGQSPD